MSSWFSDGHFFVQGNALAKAQGRELVCNERFG